MPKILLGVGSERGLPSRFLLRTWCAENQGVGVPSERAGWAVKGLGVGVAFGHVFTFR